LQRKDLTALGVRTEFRPAKWPENLKNVRAGRYMMWRVGSSAAAPDGQGALMRGLSKHVGGQNLARFRNEEFDRIFMRMSDIEDGPERMRLFTEAKRIMAVYAPYKNGVHRILTDLAHPWLHGYRRPPYWNEWWQYVDIDVDAQAKAIQ
jgi:ABC-type transport system substrate-binding protein